MTKRIEKTKFKTIMAAMFYFRECGFETAAHPQGMMRAVKNGEIWESKTMADSTVEMTFVRGA